MRALHNALEKVTAVASLSRNENAELIAAKVRGLLRGYHARWCSESMRVLDVERVYTSDLTNIDTGRKSRTFSVAGKLDVMLEIEGQPWIMDHKTTSDSITDPNAPYWRQLAIEGQVTHYMLLQWMHGVRPAGAIWDVVKKPGISPKRLTKAERASAVAGNPYFGYRLTNDEARDLAGESERESLAMYEARLAHDCTVERPNDYFQRRIVPRLDTEMLEYARELWDHGKEILHTRDTVRTTNRLPPRNSGACMLYGSPCQFLGICSGHDTPNSHKWQAKAEIHPELDHSVVGLDALTNSRIRCFQTCRRKHHYQYEMAIEHVDQEQKESLWFGHLYHVGMEAYFLTLKGQEHDSDTNGQSVSGTDSPSQCQAELAF